MSKELRGLDLEEVGVVEYLATIRGHFVPEARRALREHETRGSSIPSQVLLVVGDVLGERYYSHSRLNALFAEAGAPGEPPVGNCITKCQAWFRRVNDAPSCRPLRVLGRTIEELMEHDLADRFEEWAVAKSRVENILVQNGLEYRTGGYVVEVGTGIASRSLEKALTTGDHPSIEEEFRRALETASVDPPSALTAACSIVEAACKVYLEENELPLPSKQTIKHLWGSVQTHLGLEPGRHEDEDLRRILGGLSSMIDGLGALRTHAESAHGRGVARYRVAPRHARLAVNAAHTIVAFLLETWEARRSTL